MMRVYYAHCMALYNTPQEERDVATLEGLGFEVLNPNSEDFNRRCNNVRSAWNAYRERGLPACNDPLVDAVHGYASASAAVMELVFKPRVSPQYVEGLVFRALPDGRIPAGVAQEIEWAKQRGLLVLELPTFAYDRVLSIPLTQTYLHEVGQR